MILKSADDKSKRLALLEDLQRSTLLDFRQKKWLREELVRTRKGIKGEQDSAHYLDNYLGDTENLALMHDLRLVVDGEVAQIDHLVINRALGMYLIETKNYAGNLVINELGEYTVEYDDCRFGIPSPMEQSRRHERILAKLLERLDIVGRTQKTPDFHHVVMLHPKAVIQRPPSKLHDTRDVIKADQFPSWHDQFVSSHRVGSVFKLAMNLRSVDTVKECAQKLIRQHRPADQLHLPDFMQPKQPISSVPAKPSKASAAHVRAESAPVAASAEPAKKLICATCGIKISFPEGKFCWNNTKRFGGLQYCREHQAAF
ncbi:nuclease-related domain-containing protein [Comamonadaceae bacterium G21597-S1]|nr:nuclease-related domain-containing protein [Comamonadaceae bacterium G21597-S1]